RRARRRAGAAGRSSVSQARHTGVRRRGAAGRGARARPHAGHADRALVDPGVPRAARLPDAAVRVEGEELPSDVVLAVPDSRGPEADRDGLSAPPRVGPGLPSVAMSVPVFINCRERVTSLAALVSWLERAGCDEIYLLDNDSVYEPLLEYY